MGILLIIAVLLLLGMLWLKRDADRQEKQFANRPYVIADPAKDLSSNEKYAIVKLLAWTQGASPASAHDEEANRIVLTEIKSLGISMEEVAKILKHGMNRDPEREVDRIMSSLSEIRDRNYLAGLYRKCLRVARISGDEDTVSVVQDIFRKLGVR